MTWQPIAPLWLLLLLFIPPLVFAVWRLIAERSSAQRWAWIRRASSIILLLIISLRPATFGESRVGGNALIDVYFVIDSSLSIAAEDYNGEHTRLEGVRQDVKAIAAQLAGGRFSVITFGNTTRTVLPLTTDPSALATAVDIIIPESPYYANGSSIDQPIEVLQKVLEQNQKKSPGRGRIVFYMGDGEQTTSAAPKSFASLAPLVSGGGVLGYGTTAGGKMRGLDGEGKPLQNYVVDNTNGLYSSARSKLDESALQTIASQIGIQYFHRTQPDDATQLVHDINIQYILQNSHDRPTLNDLYWIAALPLAALLTYDMWALSRQVRQLRLLQHRSKS